MELKLLFPRGPNLQLRGIDKWNELVFDKGYSFNQSKIKGKERVELSVKPVNTLQVDKQRGKTKLTITDKLYLNKLREKYIKHCNINDDADDINDDADDSDDCASKKRCSVPLDQNADD